MSVLDRLPSNQPILILKDGKQTGAEIKAAQRRGSTSVLMKRIHSEATWDFTFTGPGTVEVLFTPDNLQFGGSFCYRLHGRINHMYGTSDLEPSNILRKPNAGKKQRWLIPYDVTGTIRLKFFFFSQCSGTFTAKKL